MGNTFRNILYMGGILILAYAAFSITMLIMGEGI